jgi:thioredoxin:protein disulfide reductase
MNSRSPLTTFRCLFAAAIVVATFSVAAETQTSPAVVDAHVVLATSAVHEGSTAKLAVVAKITSGYHINAHKPTLDYLIPTEVKFEPAAPLSVGETVYPKGAPLKFEFSDTPLSVYEGEIVVGAALKIAATARPGTYHLKGEFAYQACNDHACLPPTSVPLELAVSVVSPNVRLKAVNGDVFARIKSN